MIYSAASHLYQRTRWNDPDCSLPMVLRDRYACCFCTWKVFNKHFIIYVQFFGHFSSIKMFYHIASCDKYRFFVIFSFWFVICVILLWLFLVGYNYYSVTLQFPCPWWSSSIYLLLVYPYGFFFFIAEASWSVFILDSLAIDGPCVL